MIAGMLGCSLPSGPVGQADDVGGTYAAELLVLVGDSGANLSDPSSLHLTAHCRGTWGISGTSAGFHGHFTLAADSSQLCRSVTGSLSASLAYSGLERDWSGSLTVEGSPDRRSKVDVFTGCVYQHLALQPSSTSTLWNVSISGQTGTDRVSIIGGLQGTFACTTGLLQGRYEIQLIFSADPP